MLFEYPLTSFILFWLLLFSFVLLLIIFNCSVLTTEDWISYTSSFPRLFSSITGRDVFSVNDDDDGDDGDDDDDTGGEKILLLFTLKWRCCLAFASLFFFLFNFPSIEHEKVNGDEDEDDDDKGGIVFHSGALCFIERRRSLCLCGTGTQKILFFLKIFIYFLDPHVAKKDLICFSVFFFSCSAVFFTKMSSQSLFSKELHTQQRRWRRIQNDE